MRFTRVQVCEMWWQRLNAANFRQVTVAYRDVLNQPQPS